MKETVRELISEEKLMKRIDELAEKINKDYQGKTLNLICILKGSISDSASYPESDMHTQRKHFFHM